MPDKRNFSSFISKLPFTSGEPDTTVIIERKQGLEKYLQVCAPLLTSNAETCGKQRPLFFCVLSLSIQSVSSVDTIIYSELFHQFLKSGVQDLKEANVVNPTRSKKQNRMSFLGRTKTEDSEKAEVSYGRTGGKSDACSPYYELLVCFIRHF